MTRPAAWKHDASTRFPRALEMTHAHGRAMGLADRGLFAVVERRRPVRGRILNAGGLRPPRARRFADPSIPSAFQLPGATVRASPFAALLDSGVRPGACRPAPRSHADKRRDA